jgi:hypothetical protein
MFFFELYLIVAKFIFSTMNKQQAKDALKAGYRLRHPLFFDGEYVRIKKGKLVNDIGLVFGIANFWAEKTHADWDDNWEVFE